MTSFLEEIVRHIGDDDHRDPPPPKLAPDIEAIRLADSLAAFNERHLFYPGLIVHQKPQAAIYKDFGDNNMAIVVEMLAEPIMGTQAQAGNPHYRERYDMLVGSIEPGDDGDHDRFYIYHVDSRRFEPWTESPKTQGS